MILAFLFIATVFVLVGGAIHAIRNQSHHTPPVHIYQEDFGE